MKALSALDIHYMISEIEFLVGAKIDKIYAPCMKELIIAFHLSGKGKQQLKVNERALYLVSSKDSVEMPSEFCIFLRKKLEQSRLKAVKQLAFERIVSFELEAKDGIYHLIFEMFSKGNILLVKDEKIVIVAETQKWSERIVKAGEVYRHPSRDYNLLKLKMPDFKKLISGTSKDSIVTCLATELGLGGVYAEETCLIAKVEKHQKPKLLSEKEIKSLFSALDSLIEKKVDACLVYKEGIVFDAVPFALNVYTHLKQEKAASFSRALDELFSNEKGLLKKSKKQKELDKLNSIIKLQEEKIAELEASEKENSLKAESLYNNYKLVSEVLSKLKDASKKFSWKEMRERLKGHKLVKETSANEKAVVIKLE